MNTNLVDWNFFEQGLKGFIYKKVKDRALAADISHDVFLKVHHGIKGLKDLDKIQGWIYQIARNAITDYFRKKNRVVQPVDLMWDSSEPNFNDCVTNYIRRVVETLPDKYRVPFEMADLGNFSQHDVAEKLSLSYSAAKSRVQRARALVRKKVEEMLVLEIDAYGNAVACQSRRVSCCSQS